MSIAVPDRTAATFAKRLGKTATVGEPRATHRRTHRPYKTRVRMRSSLIAISLPIGATRKKPSVFSRSGLISVLRFLLSCNIKCRRCCARTRSAVICSSSAVAEAIL